MAVTKKGRSKKTQARGTPAKPAAAKRAGSKAGRTGPRASKTAAKTRAKSSTDTRTKRKTAKRTTPVKRARKPTTSTRLPRQDGPAPAPAPRGKANGGQSGFQVEGKNAKALFTMKLHRGEGMTLIAMNWRTGQPPLDFVGFAIEYQEPGGGKYYALNNRLGFLDSAGNVDPTTLSTLQSPIQKFRWVHFPRNANLAGDFEYRVTPMFMDGAVQLSKGESQGAPIQLARETYPGVANVTFTRGFVSSQAFVDRYEKDGPINTLVPTRAAQGLGFDPTHPDSDAALAWMGFEARAAILDTLDRAIADEAEVRVIAYDLNLPEIVERLEKLGPSLKVIIDDSKGHGGTGSAETEAEGRLVASAGRGNVLRQHMGSLQHNKTIAVNGPSVKTVVCGSTNLSWRGFFVQANNALILTGQAPVDIFLEAFDAYFDGAKNDVTGFGAAASADWKSLGLNGIDAQVSFSPHGAANAKLDEVAEDIKGATSSLLYSLAFLYESPGAVRNAIEAVTAGKDVFVYGISDKKVGGGLDVQNPDGNVAPVYATQLSENVPEPFKSEPSGGGGTRMHHKFVVIDFDKPTARVYLGSYNFSTPADLRNGENLVLVKDQRIAVSYMIEALSLFDHYSFRVAQQTAADAGTTLHLSKPPAAGEKPWFDDDYTVAHKIKDRLLFG